MSFADFKDNTMRAVVSKTIDGVLKYVNKHDDRTEALLKLTDLSEKLMGDKFEKKVFDGARNLIHNPDAKWMKYTNKVLDEIANIEVGAQDKPLEDVVIETVEVAD